MSFRQILVRQLKKAFPTANRASGAFGSVVSKITRPSGDGVIDLTNAAEGLVAERMRVMVYGLGSNNDAAPLRVYAWNRIKGAFGTPDLYVPTAILEVGCTLSAAVGVAGAPVLNTERFADTYALVATVGEARITADTTNGGTTQVFSPANDTPGWVELYTRGAELLQFDFGTTTGTPTMNALAQLY